MSEKQIGNRIRRIRQARKITLQSLAIRTGFTTGYLSKVERGLANPPIATISRIATALGVDLVDLIGEPNEDARLSIVTPDERRSVTADSSSFGYHYDALAHRIHGKAMEPFLITMTPHSTDDTIFSHAGEEMLFLLEGEIEFIYGEEHHMVGKGTCLYFDSSVPHRGQCVGDTPAQALVVIFSPEAEIEK